MNTCLTITPDCRPLGIFQERRLKLANGSAAVLYKIDQYHNCLEVYFFNCGVYGCVLPEEKKCPILVILSVD
jgi:hypothetical protein